MITLYSTLEYCGLHLKFPLESDSTEPLKGCNLPSFSDVFDSPFSSS